MVDSFAIDVKRGRRDLKFSINAKGGVCWQRIAVFAQALVLSLMSNFKNAKCSLMDQCKGSACSKADQAWIS
jgi:hypothetical protein